MIPRSFRASVVAVAVLSTLLVAAALGFAHYQILERRSEVDLEQLLTLSAQESASRVAHWLDERRICATRIAESMTLVEELRRIRQLTPEDDEYFLALYRLKQELDQNTLAQPFIYEISIHDPATGEILIASAGEDIEMPSSDGSKLGIVEARHQQWVSPIFASEIPLPDESGDFQDGVPCLFVASPIHDGTELFGVLRVRCRVLDIGDNLLRAAKYSDVYGTSDVYVVDNAGTLLSPTRSDDELRAADRIQNRSMLEVSMKPPGGDQFTQAFLQSRELFNASDSPPTFDLNGYEGVLGRRVVGAWARVADTDWACIAEIDQSEAFAPLSRMKRTTLAVSLAVGALVVGLAAWLATRLVAPLQHLADVAARLASGDRSVRCRMSRDDEIGRLAVAFDNMADSVEETLTDLERNAARLAESNQKLEAELAERERAERKLRTANAFLDSVIDNIPTMLFMKDAEDLRMVRFNKAGEELVGQSRDELIGKTDFDLYPRDEAEFFRAKDREVLNGLELVEIDEEELLTSNGVRILHTKKIPICDETGKPQFLLGISEDITEKKQTLEALKAAKESAESANRAKSDFLANMSHEIRTPMNAIIGMTDLVLDTKLEPTQRDYLTIVAESAESLLSIINQILDFSKIEAGKLELESVDFDVREEIGDTLKSLGMRAHAKNLELTWEVHSDVPHWLSGDAIRLRQVLVNLIGNAIKFTTQGEVCVHVQADPIDESQVTLHVCVRDTGIGIPAEKRERIFAAFEQADTSTTREFGGTGLGLAITLRIAEMMGGRVWVDSESGRGSTFHFTGNFGVGTERHESDELPDLSGLRVLVVDDNVTNRRILKEMLENWGMLVETAESGREAIQALQSHVAQHDSLPLVISDVNMPVMDGFMLAQALRSTDSLVDVSLILLTSGGRKGDVQRCEELGVSAHLMKPVKQSELLEAIVVAAGKRPSQADLRPDSDDAQLAMPPLKILLAEDGKANQIVAVGLLTKWGHSVVVAENGEQTIELWQSGSFDVILMDVQMPVMDGLEATQRIRELEQGTGKHIPIVAMTARAIKGDRDRCLESGMDNYVSKPVRKKELYRALSGLDQPSGQEPEPESESTFPVVDWEAALETAGGDRDLLRELVDMTLQEMPSLERQLDEAIQGRDAKTARRIAHTIKGEAAALAATATQRAAAAIEASAANDDLQTAERLTPGLHEAIHQFLCDCEKRNGSR